MVLIAGAAYYAWDALGASPPPPNTRTLMDAETGERFQVALTPDLAPFPHRNPKTGRAALWPTELCYSKDCRVTGGTHVIMNSYLGKPEPTYCPRCGAKVVMFNPRPSPDASEEPGG